jgi:hypothetical protein
MGGSLLGDIHFYGWFTFGNYAHLQVVHFWELCIFIGGSLLGVMHIYMWFTLLGDMLIYRWFTFGRYSLL